MHDKLCINYEITRIGIPFWLKCEPLTYHFIAKKPVVGVWKARKIMQMKRTWLPLLRIDKLYTRSNTVPN